jgi:tRNA threonylcarbamoyladenosine biosynthesis protein TsaE
MADMETRSLQAFGTVAAEFVSSMFAHDSHATVITLSGDVGAGKTTFVQAAAHALGIEEPVRSPTFIIMQIFELPIPMQGGFTRLVHIDAYRLKNASELEALGWRELIADPQNLIFIEWPEQVPGAVPEWAQKVTLVGDGDTRRITYGNNS